ncbi:MAG: glycosyl hydrolase, partial [Acidobacteriota bacterium]|nr:glycosyl hydrolase [Acidobacteriota bacterium]
MRRRAGWFASVLASVALVGAVALGAAPAVPGSVYNGMHWRLVGPFRGGRVLAVTGVPTQPDTWYLGSVVGGVWKTTNGGATWRPIFDHEPVASIGAIAVAASNPNVIYVGTGEAAPREDISFGDGVYKSTDAGRTWTNVGLHDSRHIGRIVVDPHNPDLVLVAAMGHFYGPNTERGVFRSADGGRTWQKVLYKDDRTGAIDVAFDPSNPTIVYAALWQADRKPWSLSSGGPGSGLYRSTDEGSTWTRLEGHGLPGGVLGKIGISVAGHSHGERVYALIEAEDGGLYRSDDAGRTWHLVNDSQEIRTRAWYFTYVFASPVNPDVVYVADNAFYKSTDGGRTFATERIPGGDNHGFWMNPLHPERMIESNDQGVVITIDGGRSWQKLDNLPIGQFYHVSTDNRFPYDLYGAQQDMGAIAIASRGWGGITSRDWYSVGGDDGESGYVLPDPTDPDLVIAGGYGGALTRFDARTKQLVDIAPWSNNNGGHPASELKYRFTWTAPLAFSPQDPHVLYMGSQYLMETTDGGMSWKILSPDLTRNDKSKQGLSGGPITKDNASAEYYDVVYSIAPSPKAAGQIWVGTDDGLVQLTRDGGKTWQNVTPKGLPEWAKVSLIEASPFDAGTAYVAVDAHKL